MVENVDEVVSILMVDDHDESLLAISSVLDPLNQNLVKCNSGEDALRQLLKRDFAVIILDVGLPDMNGFEVAEIIRERDRSRNTPIIFITGINKDAPNVSKGYSLGAVDYLFKPFDAEVLKAKVSVFVELYKKTELVRSQTEQIFLLRERERERELELEREKLKFERMVLLSEKEAAEAIAKKAIELERSNSELKQFAYIASHDLNEPLRTVSSFVELLAKDYKGKLDENADQYIAFILGAIARMKEQVKGLLNHAKIGQSSSRVTVDCGLVVDKVLRDVQSSIQQSDAVLEIGVLPTVKGVESELRLLFQNLLSNAIKFRKEGVSPIIKISAEEKGDGWEFSVSDNGIGIDLDHRDSIFEIFNRLHVEKEFSGTGIGLAHCRKIVELYGGRIWVRENPEGGSVFVFNIPN